MNGGEAGQEEVKKGSSVGTPEVDTSAAMDISSSASSDLAVVVEERQQGCPRPRLVIVSAAYGSQGDIGPMLTLARALREQSPAHDEQDTRVVFVSNGKESGACRFDIIMLPPRVESAWFQLLESTVLSSHWFQTSTCIPTPRMSAWSAR